MAENPLFIIGYIDAYGAIHCEKVMCGQTDKQHDYFWPNQTHKRWRIIWDDWSMSDSPLSKENLTDEECDDVMAFVRKRYTPPKWVIEGEEWDAIGRVRSGKKYDAWVRKWDKIYKR